MADTYSQLFIHLVFSYLAVSIEGLGHKSIIVNGMPDHVHILISIPPKYAVSKVVGFIKGKSAIMIARRFNGRQRNFTGEKFWAKGYFATTVGLEEQVVRKYIRHQETDDRRRDQLELFR